MKYAIYSLEFLLGCICSSDINGNSPGIEFVHALYRHYKT